MKEERAEIYETYRSLIRLIVSTLTFLTTANVTIIGFAFNNKSAMLVLFGSLFPILMLFFVFLSSRLAFTIFFCGMRSRSENEEQKVPFFSTALFLAKPELYQELKKIIAIDNFDDQLFKLQQIKNKFMPPYTLTILIAFALLQVLAALYLSIYFNWSFS